LKKEVEKLGRQYINIEIMQIETTSKIETSNGEIEKAIH
jgi:hypothetical protein